MAGALYYLCFLPLLVLLSFRHGPFYHGFIDTHIAIVIDQLEPYGEAISKQVGLDVISSTLRENLHVVSKGAHFGDYLSGKAKGNYFEGWYYKMVSKDKRKTVIAIPAVFFSENDSHGFMMNGVVITDEKGRITRHEVEYTRFDIKDVEYENIGGVNDSFSFKLGPNEFGNDFVKLDVPGVVKGEVRFTEALHLPTSFLYPNIMGWMSYVDALVGLQCVHKVVTVDSVLQGGITHLMNEKMEIDLSGGKGYTEGDYGNQFPRKYFWIASNNFVSNPGSSMLLSAAKIPVPNEKYQVLEADGFLGFIYDASKNEFYRFGTYTGATVNVIEEKPTRVTVEVRDLQYIYSVTAVGSRDKALQLWGPKVNEKGQFEMKRYVDEMLDAQVQVIVKKRSTGEVVFEGVGTNGGLEIQ